MAGHITDGSTAKVQVSTPLEGMNPGTVGCRRRHPQKGVPVDVSGNLRFLFGQKHLLALGPPVSGTVSPDMHFLDGTDDTALDALDGRLEIAAGVPLVAHLRDHAVPLGCVAHRVALLDGPGQRLLTVDMLAKLHRGQRNRSVHVIGCRDDHGVEVVRLFIEHFSIVRVELQACRSFMVDNTRGAFGVDIT